MGYKPAGAYYKEATTNNPATGAVQNADSLPVATANHNGVDDPAFVLTVVNLDMGRYKISGPIPASYVGGDVLNVTLSATVAGVSGKAVVDTQVLDSATASDPLANPVPGSYPSGTAGYKLGQLNPAAATYAGTVLPGNVMPVIAGDSYYAIDGRSFDFPDPGNWPSLLGATALFYLYLPSGTISRQATILNPAGPGKVLRVELSAADTATWAAQNYPMKVTATLNNGHVATEVRGTTVVTNP